MDSSRQFSAAATRIAGPFLIAVENNECSDKEISTACQNALAPIWGDTAPPVPHHLKPLMERLIMPTAKFTSGLKVDIHQEYLRRDSIYPYVSQIVVSARLSGDPIPAFSFLLQRFPPAPPFRPLAASWSLSLGHCLNFFAMNETLDEGNQWFCPSCQQHVCANKKMDIWMVPPVLIVHLKRFVTENSSSVKLNTPVDFPEHLDMSPYVIGPQREASLAYRLQAVSEHSGGLSGGHYTAHSMVGDHDWYFFNDSTVTESSLSRTRCPEVYVMFYERISDPGAVKSEEEEEEEEGDSESEFFDSSPPDSDS
jgi:hypothetical protein